MRLPDFMRRRKRRKLARKGFAQSDKIRRREPAPTDGARRRFRRQILGVLVFCLVWMVSTLSITYRREAPRVHYVVGQIADRYIYSEVAFEYEDLTQTMLRREQASLEVPHVYRLSDSATRSVLGLADDLREVAQRHGSTGGEDGEAEDDGAETEPARTGRSAVALFARLSDAQRQVLAACLGNEEKWPGLMALLTEALHVGVADAEDIASLTSGEAGVNQICILQDMAGVQRRSRVAVADLRQPEQAAWHVARGFVDRFPEDVEASREGLYAALEEVIKPNLVYDAVSTEADRRKAIAAVRPVRRVVGSKEILLRRGDRVTEEDIRQLERHQAELHSLRSLQERAPEFVVVPLLCVILLAATAYYIYITCPDVLQEGRSIVLMGMCMALQLVLCRLVANLYHMNWGTSFFLFALLPLSFAAMLLSPLLGSRAAAWCGIYCGLVGGLQASSGHALELAIVGVVSSLVAAALMRRVRKRYQVFRTGLGVGAAVCILEILFAVQGMLPAQVASRVVAQLFLYALLNGVVVALAVSTLLPLVEYVFGMTTDISLLELNDLNHPLLRRLQLEAPGTYHHSLMVATLAEQAAEAIDANPLLARVCAYFHDVGKLAHPEYFTENATGQNPHDELQPRMSSIIILNHVKEGISLALKYKLKRPIREAIAQHHGTSLVYYFYRRALERDAEVDGTRTGEHDYRYPGPRPRRPEIALIAIADSCEAAVRSLEKPTPQKISAVVNDIVFRRIRDHQFDEANLTLAQLSRARARIAQTLSLMLHSRVQYPKEGDNEDSDGKGASGTAADKPKTAVEDLP